MAFNVQTFLTRLGSAVLFSALMLGCLLWNELAFLMLFALVCFLCLREYISIIEKITGHYVQHQHRFLFLGAGLGTYLLTASIPMQLCENALATLMHQHLLYYNLGLSLGFIGMMLFFKRSPAVWLLLSGLGYIPLSLGLLMQLRYQSLLLPVMLILFIWMNDTMAYLTGSFVGKRPFFPAISPKKTKEGTLGGIVFTMVFAAIWGALTNWFPIWQWIALAGIASFVGTAGDLVESKMKRMAGIKESGQMMPGHGGALDRFDSLLLAAPVAFLFALIFMKCFPYQVFG